MAPSRRPRHLLRAPHLAAFAGAVLGQICCTSAAALHSAEVRSAGVVSGVLGEGVAGGSKASSATVPPELVVDAFGEIEGVPELEDTADQPTKFVIGTASASKVEAREAPVLLQSSTSKSAVGATSGMLQELGRKVHHILLQSPGQIALGASHSEAPLPASTRPDDTITWMDKLTLEPWSAREMLSVLLAKVLLILLVFRCVSPLAADIGKPMAQQAK
mmetsp:Transcript_1620/g.3824  ORF Transcript_1620/g.3824 Transcript_1620/m.3824 type:complete len:218 (-) Transcript_1620:96-749(-)